MSRSRDSAIAALGCAFVLAACGDNTDPPTEVDAPVVVPIDAATIDGRAIDATEVDAADIDAADIDAAVDAAVDAPGPTALNVNGGFEVGTMSGWICNGNATCSVASTAPHGGGFTGVALNLPNDYSGFRVNVLSLMCPTDPTCATGVNHLGNPIRFHAWIKNVGAATAVRMVLRWNCTDTGANGYQWLNNHSNPTPDVWTEYDSTFTVPNCNYGGTDNNLYLYTGTQGATEIHMDDLEIIDTTM